jgi:predicted phage gp36 major capsid-like protein
MTETCPVCPQEFRTASARDGHLRLRGDSLHLGFRLAMANAESPLLVRSALKCPVCQRFFRNEQGLGGHLRHTRDAEHQAKHDERLVQQAIRTGFLQREDRAALQRLLDRNQDPLGLTPKERQAFIDERRVEQARRDGRWTNEAQEAYARYLKRLGNAPD